MDSEKERRKRGQKDSPPNSDETPTAVIERRKEEIKKLLTAKFADSEALTKLLTSQNNPDKNILERNMNTPQQERMKKTLASRIDNYRREISRKKKEIQRLKGIVAAATPKSKSSEESKRKTRKKDENITEALTEKEENNNVEILTANSKPPKLDMLIKGSGELKDLLEGMYNELKVIKLKQQELQDALNNLKNNIRNEYAYFHAIDHRNKERLQELENRLNEASELNTAQVTNIKQVMHQMSESYSLEVTELRNINQNRKEMIESVQKQFSQVEQRVGPQSHVHELFLGAANLIVEIVKFIMFIISGLVTALTNVCGDRQQASILLIVLLVGALLWIYSIHLL